MDKPVSKSSDSLENNPPPIAGPQSLDDLRELLDSLPAGEAVKWIQAFLKDGRDKDTGLSFVIAAGGSLREWPTFRTFLLDTVFAIDPTAAAAISREILAKPTTADEWALALRNIARAGEPAQTRDFLHKKTVELLRNPEWQAEPSVGYLNAFDVLVHTEAIAETPLISGLIQNKERKDLAHAAFLTLDRLVQRRPYEMIEFLTTDATLAASRPEMTAQQIARADLRIDRQRELVARWLLSPERTATELNAFTAVYPNHNQFVSNNLLTKDDPVPGPVLSAHDREVLGIVTAWSNDSAFQPVGLHINSMIDRLAGFAGGKTEDSKTQDAR